MSKISRCKQKHTAPSKISLGLIGRVVLVLVIVLGAALAQLHLQFSIDRMNASMVPMNELEGELQSRVNNLEKEYKSLSQATRLWAAAEEFNLTRSDPRREVLEIDRETYMRYAMARQVMEREVVPGDSIGESRVAWLSEFGRRFVSDAYAGTTGTPSARPVQD